MTATTIVLIDKKTIMKEVRVKNLSKDILYKKCGLKTNQDFKKRTIWELDIEKEKYVIELWCKNNGNANTENKYDFPPPVDNELYFGTCALIRVDKNDKDIILNFTINEWKKIYEELFGGFHDLNDEETESEDELEKIPSSMKTSSGYLKDDFVVDDSCNESESENEVSFYENEDENSFSTSDEEELVESELDEEEYLEEL
tara:strand:+ start:193 stop:795 length:603 start_codon:yes stop_codon:yes gene_type:complete